jgi:hypothetical protein
MKTGTGALNGRALPGRSGIGVRLPRKGRPPGAGIAAAGCLLTIPRDVLDPGGMTFYVTLPAAGLRPGSGPALTAAVT